MPVVLAFVSVLYVLLYQGQQQLAVIRPYEHTVEHFSLSLLFWKECMDE